MASGMKGELSDKEKEALLEAAIGYKFQDSALRTRAITRRAWVEDRKPAKEKEQEALATLGDAIINVIVLSQLIQEDDDEGIISKKRDGLVSHPALTKKAQEAGIKCCLKLGNCEGNDARWDNGKALGESLESIVGAVYLDALNKNAYGLNYCTEVLRKLHVIPE